MPNNLFSPTFFTRFFAHVFPLSLLLAVSSCRPDPDPGPSVQGDYAAACARGIYILNEGLFNMNNSTLSYFDYGGGVPADDLFKERNGRGLGDTGNDLQSYGAKLYCVVNMSENLEIMDMEDASLLKTVALDGKSPRRVVFHGGKAYVSCFDGHVVRVDTASLSIDGEVRAGANPDGMCVSGDKLYVANTGGYNAPDYGHTVSVVDLTSFAVSGEIEVALNPTVVQSGDDGSVFVACMGNYRDVPATLQKISPAEGRVVHDYRMPVIDFILNGDRLYFYSPEYDADLNPLPSAVKVLDVAADRIVDSNFIADGTQVQSPCLVAVNPVNGDVYVADVHDYTVNGEVYCFDRAGKKRFALDAGLNPMRAVLKY